MQLVALHKCGLFACASAFCSEIIYIVSGGASLNSTHSRLLLLSKFWLHKARVTSVVQYMVDLRLFARCFLIAMFEISAAK